MFEHLIYGVAIACALHGALWLSVATIWLALIATEGG